MATLKSPTYLKRKVGYKTVNTVLWSGIDIGNLVEDLEALNVVVSGTVDSVNSGTGITVDNTDPNNPVINFTGGTDDVANDSGVAGATASDALDALYTAIGALGSDDIANNSGVAGATVSDALDVLDTIITGFVYYFLLD